MTRKNAKASTDGSRNSRLREAVDDLVPLSAERWRAEPNRAAMLALAEVADLRRFTERETARAVATARRAGVAWAVIGGALGMSGEGARKRYGGREGSRRRGNGTSDPPK